MVYDPFCGTGSILLSAAHLGAHTLGTGEATALAHVGHMLGSPASALGAHFVR